MFAHFVCMYRISHFKQCNDSSSRVSYFTQPIGDCMLLAGNPLIKIEAVQVVFYSHGQTGLRSCQMESKTQDLNISSRNRFYYLHKLVSFNYRKRPRRGKKKKQTKTTNTKQSFTLNKLTEIYLRRKWEVHHTLTGSNR